MCGIAGWYCFSDHRPTQDDVRALFLSQENRGTHASGLAYFQDEKIYQTKAAIPAREFVASLRDKEWGPILAAHYGLVHARAATKGSPKNNDNNHPVVGYGWVVVHNGVITNDDELVEKLVKDRVAEVDTVAINAVLSQGNTNNASLGALGTLVGSASIAAASVTRPREVILARVNGSNVHLAWDAPRKILFWGSDSDMLDIVTPVNVGGISLSTWGYIRDHTALVLSPGRISRWRITQRPFVLPPKYLTTPVRGYPGGAAEDGINRLPPSTFGRPTTTTKPPPPAVGYELFALDNYHRLDKPTPVLLGVSAAAHPVRGTLPEGTTLPTGYGRWVFGKDEKGTPAAVFRPHRRIRAWWKDLVGSETEMAFPVDAYTKESLSSVYALEHVAIRDRNGYKTTLLMCPWCGIMHTASSWTIRANTCEWCNMSSKMPECTH